MSNYSKQEVQDVIDNGQRLIKEVEAALAETDRFFEAHNINPRESIEFLRKHAGEAAVEAVQQQVQVVMNRLEENVEKHRVHGVTARPTGKRPKLPRNMV